MTEPTVKQVKRFVTRRNRSEFRSNLQFIIDAEACGFEPKDMGEAVKLEEGGYRWRLSHGEVQEDASGRIAYIASDGEVFPNPLGRFFSK